jgi:hypothetical protein
VRGPVVCDSDSELEGPTADEDAVDRALFGPWDDDSDSDTE